VPDTDNANEAIIRAYIEAVFNGHDLSNLETWLADDLVSVWMGQTTLRGLAAWREGMQGFFDAFPDITYTLDDIFFSGDRGVWRGHWHGTQRGAWAGIAPSGKTATWTAVIIGRMQEGKLVEDWVEYDRLGLFRQLGAIPLGD